MTTTRLLEAERELALERLGYLDLAIANAALEEGAWTGSMGGHDPDFQKLRGGLKRFWIEKAAKDPHPFAYCVRHLRKHVANPERLCAWLKDQALGRTNWRKGSKQVAEADEWAPSVEELRAAVLAYEEAAADLGIDVEGDEGGDGSQGDEGREGDGAPPDGGDAGAEGSEAGGEGSDDGADDPAGAPAGDPSGENDGG